MDSIESLHTSIVLDDVNDQLDILRSLPARYQAIGFEIPTNTISNKTRNSEKNELKKLLEKTNNEIINKNSYNILVKYLEKQMSNFSFLEKIDSQHEDDTKIEQLKSGIANLKKQKEGELWKRKVICEHLKDQIQEMKLKFSMEKSYLLKSTDVDVRMVQKRCQMEESSHVKSLEELKLNFDDENHINAEMSSFLRGYTKKQRVKLEDWIIKSEEKISEKQKELDDLKVARARDSDKLRELLINYHEFEKVAVEDRVEKEKLKMNLQLQVKQNTAAIKIQSWWRGMMVRRQLGPYKPKSKKGKKAVTKNGKPIKSRR